MNSQNLKTLSTEKAREIGAKRRKKISYSKEKKEIYKRTVGNSYVIRFKRM